MMKTQTFTKIIKDDNAPIRLQGLSVLVNLSEGSLQFTTNMPPADS